MKLTNVFGSKGKHLGPVRDIQYSVFNSNHHNIEVRSKIVPFIPVTTGTGLVGTLNPGICIVPVHKNK